MYLFTMQLIQIPLTAVGRTPVIKRNNRLGNMVFWLGLYAGFPCRIRLILISGLVGSSSSEFTLRSINSMHSRLRWRIEKAKF